MLRASGVSGAARALVRAILVLFSLLGGLIAPLPAEATHLRYLHTFAGLVEGSPTTYRFTQQAAWRRGFSVLGLQAPVCLAPRTWVQISCSGPSRLPVVGDIVVTNWNFQFGDGSVVASPIGGATLAYQVTSVDVAGDWLFGVAVDTRRTDAVVPFLEHRYTVSSATARVDSAARLSRIDGDDEHINNPDGTFVLQTRLLEIGSGNRTAVSGLPPIVLCPTAGDCVFDIPATEPDGDRLVFRLSAPTEASSGGEFRQP